MNVRCEEVLVRVGMGVARRDWRLAQDDEKNRVSEHGTGPSRHFFEVS